MAAYRPAFHQPVLSVTAVHSERLPHQHGGTRYAQNQTEYLAHAEHIEYDHKNKYRQQPAGENKEVLGFQPLELYRSADTFVDFKDPLTS